MSEGEAKSNNISERLKALLKSKGLGGSHQSQGSQDARSRRASHRVSEKDEDDDLINAEDTAAIVPHLETQPPCVTGEMRDYQIEGLNWLVALYHNKMNGILADEMGLGKTLQSISILGYLRSFHSVNGPHLVICPKSTLGNWINEFRTWAPEINAKRFHGSKDERPEIKQKEFQPGDFDVMVTTYETAVAEKSFISKTKWQYVIVDEAHRIKNENSILSRVVRTFTASNRLLITGTPLQNNLHELWAMLNFIMPDLFGSSEEFDDYFDTSKDVDRDVIQQLHHILRPFLLRRLKGDVEHSLLPKKEVRVFVPLAEFQRQTYRNILERNIGALNDVGATRVQLLNLVMQLRKCCNHPYLFDGLEQPPFVTDDRLINASGKMQILDRLLSTLHANGDRVLLFSQMTRMLDILEDYVLWRGYKYCRLDGSTSGEERDAQMADFNREGSDKFLFMLSTRAGGLGINLYTANIVVLYDSDWNPQADLQAMDRAHRIGQKKQVTVYRFVCEDTVEEGVVKKAQKKLMLDQLVIQQGKLLDKSKPLSKDEMLTMLKRGAQNILLTNATTEPVPRPGCNVDFDEVMKRSLERTSRENEELKQTFGDQANRMNFTFDGSGMYAFEGTDYKETDKERKERIDVAYIALPKREHKKATYNDNTYFKQQKTTSKPRPPRQPELYKFQFHDSERLDELRHKETECFQKIMALHTECEQQNNFETYEEKRKEIEETSALTAEEKTELNALLEGGFGAWTKKDFNNFVRACEKYGRSDIESIAKQVEGKSPEQVKEYHKVFFDRYQEIDGWERIIKGIEKSERVKQRMEEVRRLLAEKVGGNENAIESLKVPQSVTQKRGYVDENDRFLIHQLHKLGYGDDAVYHTIQLAIRSAPQFRFDYYFKSRNPDDLKKRCETLIRALEKEKIECERLERDKRDKEQKRREVLDASKKRSRPPTPKDAAPKKRAKT